MRRLILVDALTSSGLLGLTEHLKFSCGLLIGQITEDKDYVVHYIVTPSYDTEESGGTVLSPNKDENEIQESWITQHAKQVTRLLPGGLDVLGIFVVAPNPKYETKLRQVLFSVYKGLSRHESSYSSIHSFSSSRVAVEICTVTKKILCRTYNVNDHQSNAAAADWKAVSDQAQTSWTKLETKLTIDLDIYVEKAKAKSSLMKQLNTGLTKYFHCIQNATLLFENKLLDKSIPLFTEKKTKGNFDPKKQIDVQVLMKMDEPQSSKSSESGAFINVKGSIQVRAFVQQKVTCEYAEVAVKKDIIRSILSRCEIHCADCLVTDEEESNIQGVHELPRRVFAPINKTNVSLSDYILSGEQPIDSMDVFTELLGITPLEDEIEDMCELLPSSTDTMSGCSSEEDLRNEETVEKIQKINLMYPLMVSVTTVLAIAVSYLSYSSIE